MAICGVRAREIGKRFSRSSTYGTRAKLILRKKHAEVQPPSPAENVAEVDRTRRLPLSSDPAMDSTGFQTKIKVLLGV